MFNWKMLLQMVLPMLEMIGTSKINEDDNDTGKDDILGQSILFGVKIFRAILANDTGKLEKMIPKDILQSQVAASSFKVPTK